MHSEHGFRERQACAALGLSRTVFRYEPEPGDDSPISEALLGLADRYPRYGFGKLFEVLRGHGFRWVHNRVYRAYCLLKMNPRRKGKKRLPSRNPQPHAVPPCANVCWSIDFMHDTLASGLRFRAFNVLDDFSRECSGIEVDTNLPAERVLRFLDRIVTWRGLPAKLRMDNGPELIFVLLADWAEKNGVALEFIQPDKPTQDSYSERFDKTYREEVLDFYLFKSLTEQEEITENWLRQYTEERPHESLGDLTPAEFLKKNSPKEVSTVGRH